VCAMLGGRGHWSYGLRATGGLGGCGPETNQAVVVGPAPTEEEVALGQPRDGGEAGAQPRHRPTACGGWPDNRAARCLTPWRPDAG